MPHDRWHELSNDECQALLAGSHLGRVALVEGGRPLILPVNYVLDDAAVVFPTDLERLRRLPLVPWAPGAKPHYVWVRPEEVTGRRISVADLPFNWWG